MYYTDEEPVDAAAYAPERRSVRWQHFSAWNYVMAAVLKMRRQIDNPAPSIDA